MFLPIVVYGHPILRKISEDITPEYPELDQFIRDLFQTMDEADGVGLAAPQVGRNIRIFVVDANAFEEMDPDCKGFRKAFINALGCVVLSFWVFRRYVLKGLRKSQKSGEKRYPV